MARGVSTQAARRARQHPLRQPLRRKGADVRERRDPRDPALVELLARWPHATPWSAEGDDRIFSVLAPHNCGHVGQLKFDHERSIRTRSKVDTATIGRTVVL